jgi:membrane protein YqaA with SNARE-associated domain
MDPLTLTRLLGKSSGGLFTYLLGDSLLRAIMRLRA